MFLDISFVKGVTRSKVRRRGQEVKIYIKKCQRRKVIFEEKVVSVIGKKKISK